MKRTGVTLIELLIVVVIIGILAAIGVPIYTGKIERTKGERAIANIEIIVSAWKMYLINHNNAYPTPNSPGYGAGGLLLGDVELEPGIVIPGINNALNLDISDDNFSYIIIYPGGDVGNLDTLIIANRNDGNYQGAAICYEHDDIDGDPDGWGHDPLNSDWPWLPQN